MSDLDLAPIHLPPANEILRQISAGTAAATGENFFHVLLRHLADVLGVQSAFITECTDETRGRVRTLSFLKEGSFTDNIEYDLEGTACEGVIAGAICYYPAHTHQLFAKEKGVESYLGLPIHNTDGDILGHLAIYDSRPMPETLDPDGKAVLEIFAARAGAELDRLRTLRALQTTKAELERRVEERTAALRTSEEAYRDLYEEAPNVYISVGTDGLVRRANHRAEELFGYPLAQLKGQPIFNFMADTPGGKAKGRQLFARFVAGIESLNEELELQRADGQIIYCSVSVRPITNAQGQVEASRSIYVDITARKKAEEERERLIAELDAFAHTVAHDLKNPLTGILAYAELLQTDWADAATRANAAASIQQNGHKMNSIIKELLTLAEMRQVEKAPRHPLDMGRIVQEAYQRLRHQFETTQAELILPKEWPVVLGYAPWVEEVWANYLSNGLKYGGQPPRLELGAAASAKGQIRFWVRDNGPGLSAGEQGQLFAPFTRLNQARATGHGLGLSIVQRIVTRLGGEVGVESEPGAGSTFFFTLPTA